MSSNWREIIKKLIPVFGEKPARGLPKPHTPSPRTAPESGDFYMWRKRQIHLPDWDAREREGGENPFLLLIALKNCAHLLSVCLASKNGVLCSEGRAYKRAPEQGAGPQSTALHSTGNTSVKNSVHKNEVGHNSTHGKVSLCYFSRWITAAQSLHFQHLMWT